MILVVPLSRTRHGVEMGFPQPESGSLRFTDASATAPRCDKRLKRTKPNSSDLRRFFKRSGEGFDGLGARNRDFAIKKKERNTPYSDLMGDGFVAPHVLDEGIAFQRALDLSRSQPDARCQT